MTLALHTLRNMPHTVHGGGLSAFFCYLRRLWEGLPWGDSLLFFGSRAALGADIR